MIKQVKPSNHCLQIIYIIILILISPIPLYSKPVAPSCRYELTEAIKKEHDHIRSIISSGFAWKVKYTISTTGLNSIKKQYLTSNQSGEMIVGNDLRIVSTDNANIYIDKYDAFFINKSNNIILHTLTHPNDLKLKDEGYIQIIEDSLFNVMTVTDCSIVTLSNKKTVSYNLKSNQPNCKFANMSIFVDQETQTIKRFHVMMNPVYQKEIKEYTYDIIDETTLKLDNRYSHVKDFILNKSGKLNSTYCKYQLEEPFKNK